jgi:dTDP-4-amino-4,6-dideoxygalactose transaminase
VNLVALFYRVPLAMPYWNGAVYQTMLRSLWSGRVIDGADLDDLRSRLVQELAVEDAILCGSGSLALEIALRACKVEQGDEVVIPTFCCTAVVAPILATGATPVLADVGEELNLTVGTVRAVLTQKTRAIIVPHLFGNPADIEGIAELAARKNIRVIDDAAQALGATIAGRPVGSFADAGILSFGNEKICFGLGGGVAIFRDKKVLPNALQLHLTQPKFLSSLGKLASTLGGWRWRRLTAPLVKLSSGLRQRSPESAPIAYRRESMANLQAAVAKNLMQTLRENIQARRERVRAYQKLLAGAAGLQLIPHQSGSACLTQVVRLLRPRDRRDLAVDAITALARNGYEIQGSYVPIHRLSNFGMCVWDHLPHAERIWADLIELPCEPDVELSQVEQISAIVKSTVHS